MADGTDAVQTSTARSPWILLVALGLATSELGILVGSVPIAVFGVVVFGGSSAGVVHEAGFAVSPARPMQLLGALLVVAGAGLWLAQIRDPTLDALLAATATDGLARRGLAIVISGSLLVALGTVGGRLGRRRA